MLELLSSPCQLAVGIQKDHKFPGDALNEQDGYLLKLVSCLNDQLKGHNLCHLIG